MQFSSPHSGRDRRPTRLVLPLLLIVVGTLFLLNNLGIVPWSVWLSLARLWPVILILLGLDVLLGRRSGALATLLTAVVLIGVVAAAVALTFGNPNPATASNAEAWQQRTTTAPLGNATSGDVSLNFPAGTLNLSALPTKGDNLFEVTSTMPPGMQLNVHSALRLNGRSVSDGNVAQATLSANGDRVPWWPFGGSHSAKGMTWNLRLAPGVPLSLRISEGAGQSDLDLTHLIVREITVNSGAGQTTLHLPTAAGQTSVDVHSGAGQVVLIVPPDVGAYIHRPGSMVDVHVPSDRFHDVGDGYQTANYATATNRADVTLHLGVGSVDVR